MKGDIHRIRTVKLCVCGKENALRNAKYGVICKDKKIKENNNKWHKKKKLVASVGR